VNYPFLIVLLGYATVLGVVGYIAASFENPRLNRPGLEWWRPLVGWLLRWERDEQGRYRRGSWSQTYTGKQIYQLDPLPEDICYDDICVGICREGRYVNQTREHYNVGEHSVIVSLYCERLARERGWPEDQVRAVAREGLLHDATEAYLGDVSRHLKRQRVMRGYRHAEARWERCVHAWFGITSTPETAALVKEVDSRLVLDEIDALLIDPDMWSRAGRYLDMKPLGADIAGMNWEQSCAAYSQRFAELFPDFVDDRHAEAC